MEGLAFESPKTAYMGPTKNGIATVQDYLLSEMRRLSCLNVMIAKLQSTLADLKLQRDTLNAQLDNYRSLITPIRRLVPEILQEVFKRCLPTTHNAIMSRREVPFLLCCVCRRWRQIALSTPQLWASIHIAIPSDIRAYPFSSVTHSQRNASLLSGISSWLSRSGTLPLSISVSFTIPVTDCGPRLSNHIIQPYLDVLALYKSRWHSIHLSLFGFDWTTTLSRFSPNDLPMLEDIYISGPLQVFADNSGGLTPPELVPLAKDSGILLAPSLRLIAMPFEDRSSSLLLQIHWQNLTSLEIVKGPCRYGIRDVAQVLSLCPKLEKLSIPFSNAYLGAGSRLPQVDLPNLCSISFTEDIRRVVINTFFRSLHTPQLRHLACNERNINVRYTGGSINPPAAKRFLKSLSIFLNRLTLPLEELELGLRAGSGVDVIGVLQLVPELKRLSLRDLSKPQDIPLPHVAPISNNLIEYCFQDAHLTSLTPPEVSRGMEEGDGTGVNDESSASGSSSYSSGVLPQRLDYAYPICSCPKLEVFHCNGAAFSGAALLKFLRSRCHDSNPNQTCEGSHGVARLRKVKVIHHLPPGDCGWEETRERIEELQATNPFSALSVTFVPTIEYPTLDSVQPTSFSPYDGAGHFAGFTSHCFASPRRQDMIPPTPYPWDS